MAAPPNPYANVVAEAMRSSRETLWQGYKRMVPFNDDNFTPSSSSQNKQRNEQQIANKKQPNKTVTNASCDPTNPSSRWLRANRPPSSPVGVVGLDIRKKNPETPNLVGTPRPLIPKKDDEKALLTMVDVKLCEDIAPSSENPSHTVHFDEQLMFPLYGGQGTFSRPVATPKTLTLLKQMDKVDKALHDAAIIKCFEAPESSSSVNRRLLPPPGPSSQTTHWEGGSCSPRTSPRHTQNFRSGSLSGTLSSHFLSQRDGKALSISSPRTEPTARSINKNSKEGRADNKNSGDNIELPIPSVLARQLTSVIGITSATASMSSTRGGGGAPSAAREDFANNTQQVILAPKSFNTRGGKIPENIFKLQFRIVQQHLEPLEEDARISLFSAERKAWKGLVIKHIIRWQELVWQREARNAAFKAEQDAKQFGYNSSLRDDAVGDIHLSPSMTPFDKNLLFQEELNKYITHDETADGAENNRAANLHHAVTSSVPSKVPPKVDELPIDRSAEALKKLPPRPFNEIVLHRRRPSPKQRVPLPSSIGSLDAKDDPNSVGLMNHPHKKRGGCPLKSTTDEVSDSKGEISKQVLSLGTIEVGHSSPIHAQPLASTDAQVTTSHSGVSTLVANASSPLEPKSSSRTYQTYQEHWNSPYGSCALRPVTLTMNIYEESEKLKSPDDSKTEDAPQVHRHQRANTQYRVAFGSTLRANDETNNNNGGAYLTGVADGENDEDLIDGGVPTSPVTASSPFKAEAAANRAGEEYFIGKAIEIPAFAENKFSLPLSQSPATDATINPHFIERVVALHFKPMPPPEPPRHASRYAPASANATPRGQSSDMPLGQSHFTVGGKALTVKNGRLPPYVPTA